VFSKSELLKLRGGIAKRKSPDLLCTKIGRFKLLAKKSYFEAGATTGGAALITAGSATTVAGAGAASEAGADTAEAGAASEAGADTGAAEGALEEGAGGRVL
jgi:hypothetical protein